MIDQSIRSKGIGASEIAAIVGLDPRRGPFDIWAEKLGKVSPRDPDARMRAGKKMERVIAELYGEECSHPVKWLDVTMQNGKRPWQVYTPDAVTDYPAGELCWLIECKAVAYDQAHHWGEPSTDEIPTQYLTQCHWQMSASGFDRVDVAAFFGGFDLRVYTVRKDAEIEAALLEAGELFWKRHIVEGIEPEIGATETAARYLRERFPRPTANLREATPEELEMALEYRDADEVYKLAEKKRDTLKMQLAERIGDAEGITFPGGKITYKLVKGCTYTVTKEASRRFLPKFDERKKTAA